MPMPSPRFYRFAAMATFLAASATAGAVGVVVQVTDAAGKPVENAVVYAEADGGQALPAPKKSGEISQKGLKFNPLVSVIQTGSMVYFPNNDKVRHHIYSFSPAHKFDQKLYSGTTAEPQTFEKAGVVVLGCNIHDKMLAYVRVVDTPYFAKTDASGAATVEAPAGKYMLKAWHADMTGNQQPLEQPVTVKADGNMNASFKLTLKAPAHDADSAAY
jgi:plastocyanin